MMVQCRVGIFREWIAWIFPSPGHPAPPCLFQKSYVIHFNSKIEFENRVKAEQLHQWGERRVCTLCLSHHSQPSLGLLSCLPAYPVPLPHHLLNPYCPQQLLRPLNPTPPPTPLHWQPWWTACPPPSVSPLLRKAPLLLLWQGRVRAQNLSSHKSRTEPMFHPPITVTCVALSVEGQWRSTLGRGLWSGLIWIGRWGWSCGRASSVFRSGLASWPTAGSKVTLPTPCSATHNCILRSAQWILNIHTVCALSTVYTGFVRHIK